MIERTITTMILTAGVFLSAAAGNDWRGKVRDENGEPAPYVNVVLLSKADSSIVSGTVTDKDGLFNIVTDRDGGMIMVSMIGYKTLYVNPSADMEISLVPDGLAIEGAVATVVLPKTKLTGEGLQTAVRGSVLETVGTAQDVLERTPGLIKGQNGLEVIGKGSPMVFVNGRRITDQTELDRLQSNEIQSVEVISNPGAQYNATVRSVVKIRTVRHQGEGFGFNAAFTDSQSLRKKDNNDPSGNLNLNYRIKSVDIFAGVNVLRYTTRQESDISAETYGTPTFVSDGSLVNDYQTKGAKTNLGVNWQISENHSIGAKADWGTNFSVRSFQELTEKVERDGVLYDDIVSAGSYGNGDRAPYTLGANIYYNGTAGKLGIDLNLDYYGAYDSQAALTDEKSQMRDDAGISTTSHSGNDLYAGKLVLSYPLWRGQLQVGTEETFSRRRDSYTISGAQIPASSSKVREDNYAVFASYGFGLKKAGQFNVGVRYEHVDYSFEDLEGEGSFSRKYDNVFPNVSYSVKAGPVQLALSYSTKTQRPDFSMLSSAVRYNSRYILQSGNSALQPQIVNDANLMANWKWMTFVMNYSRADRAIATWSERFNDDGVVLVRPVNLEKPMRNLSAYLTAGPTVGIWSMNYTVGLQHQWLTIDAPDPREADGVRRTEFSDRTMVFANLFNTLRVKGGWQFELGGSVHGRGYFQNLLMTNIHFDLTAAVQKAFLKDGSLVVRLEGKDLAGLGRFNVFTDFGSHIIRQTNKMDTQRLVLSLRYRFNTAQSKYKGTGAGREAAGRMK